MSAQAEALATRTLNDPRWQAVLTRDARANEQFVYSVASTGVYCRPSCGARKPRPEHVAFHASARAAELAGFRPCKRCKPDHPSLAQQQAKLVGSLCRLIEQSDPPPTLGELAQRAGMSSHHLHRVFKAITGLTPRGYALARRAERVRTELTQSETVTEAIYAAGYGSSGRFYASSNRVLGMTPTRFRAGGTNLILRFAIAECSLGSILVAASQQGVCCILLGDDPETLARDLQDRFAQADLVGGDADFDALVAKVVASVEAPQLGLDLPLDVRGTAFQQRVWRALLEIPVGASESYSEVAARIGAPGSARAVAGACAQNPLAVVIPCHRVVRRDGVLSGYRWGVERKRALLERESGAEEAPRKHRRPPRSNRRQH